MIGYSTADLPTPALIIDIDCMEKNLATMAEALKRRGKIVRPHIKTHKIPALAKLQVQLGAVGITAAKVSEAEIMASNGINDILIANQIIENEKLSRLTDLAKKTRVSILIDCQEGLLRLVQTAEKAHVQIGVLLEIETGDCRCGVLPEDALSLAKEIKKYKSLEFIGLETFGGQIAHATDYQEMLLKAKKVVNTLIELKAAFEKNDIEVKEISIGGTPAANILAELDGPTELRPGVYIFNDVATVYRQAATFDDCALTVLATIISKPDVNRVVIDAGGKALSYARPGTVFGKETYHGVIKGKEDIAVKRLSEEHGILEDEKGLNDFKIGDKIEIIPAHACPVVNLFDKVYYCRNGVVENILPIEARGKME